MRSRRSSSRSACSRTCVGHAGLFDLGAVLVDDAARRPRPARGGSTPSACAGSTRAAASGRRTRRPRGSGGGPAARPGARAGSSSASSQALGDVERLEQLDLLLEGQVGGVAGGVGERAGLGDRAQERGDAAVVAAQLEDLLDDGAVLALELARAAVDRDVVGALVDLDAQAAGGSAWRGAGDAAGDALERRAAAAAGQAHALGDAGDGADRGVLALVARDEQDALARRRRRPAA